LHYNSNQTNKHPHENALYDFQNYRKSIGLRSYLKFYTREKTDSFRKRIFSVPASLPNLDFIFPQSECISALQTAIQTLTNYGTIFSDYHTAFSEKKMSSLYMTLIL
jgi:hypothetical protein